MMTRFLILPQPSLGFKLNLYPSKPYMGLKTSLLGRTQNSSPVLGPEGASNTGSWSILAFVLGERADGTAFGDEQYPGG